MDGTSHFITTEQVSGSLEVHDMIVKTNSIEYFLYTELD